MASMIRRMNMTNTCVYPLNLSSSLIVPDNMNAPIAVDTRSKAEMPFSFGPRSHFIVDDEDTVSSLNTVSSFGVGVDESIGLYFNYKIKYINTCIFLYFNYKKFKVILI